MHDALQMRFVEPGAYLAGDFERLVNGQRSDAAQFGKQILAFDEFHREAGHAVQAIEFVYATDILVRDLPRQAHLFAQVLLHFLFGGDARTQNLEGYDFAGFEVADFVHYARAAGSDLAQNFVACGDA